MIKYLIMDVDGTLTDGKIYMGDSGEIMKAFSIKDGVAINYIIKPAGIVPIVITGRTSRIVENRCRELDILKCFQGVTDKISQLHKCIDFNDLKNCAYFGDDLPDLECMKTIKNEGGLVGCPSDADKSVQSIADYICKSKGGEGALREFAEWIVSNDKA